MAQLDPNLILGAKTPQIESPVNALAKVLEVQGMQQGNQARGMQMEAEQAAQQKQNRLAQLLAGQYGTAQDRESALLQGGFMDEAGKLQKGRMDAEMASADIGKKSAETEKAKIANTLSKIEMLGQIMAGVRDQLSYEQALSVAQANGIDVSKSSPVYNPQEIEVNKQRALSVAQQLEQVWKQKGYDLDVQQFGETQRKNKVGESLTMRGQDITTRGQNITMRGQDMTDARSVEKNAIDAQKKTDKPMTDAQSKANLFGTRMQEADRIMTELEGKYSPMAVNAKVAAGEVPMVGGIAGYAGNLMLSPEGQQAEQAQRDFINAVLRRESGAVISPSEFTNAKQQYFPQQGDSKALIAQKANNRKLAISGMEVEVPGGFKRGPSLTNAGPQSGGATGSWDGAKQRPALADIFK